MHMLFFYKCAKVHPWDTPASPLVVSSPCSVVCQKKNRYPSSRMIAGVPVQCPGMPGNPVP